MQTRLQSAFESFLNIAIGFGVAVGAQYVIFPVFDIQVTHSEHFMIGGFFTVVSFIRSYLLRRFFNYFHSVRKCVPMMNNSISLRGR